MPVPPIPGARWQRDVTTDFRRYVVLFNGRLNPLVLAASDVAGWVIIETSRRIADNGSIVRGTERRKGYVQIVSGDCV